MNTNALSRKGIKIFKKDLNDVLSEVFQKPYNFPNGLPKIHEHDKKPPQAFGIFIENRLALLYTYECDLGDGWEDIEVHNNPPAIRDKALKMGANILFYVFLE